jgi:hypothetical protein
MIIKWYMKYNPVWLAYILTSKGSKPYNSAGINPYGLRKEMDPCNMAIGRASS